MTAETVPLCTVISSHGDGRRRHFTRGTGDPPLHACYRPEWRFRAAPNNQQQTKETR
ncbi:hypothetical protein [Kitasatospora sp. NPDC059827]|uniref:hypothetical protein n=1 Tax=Kitasatospora sp. NPDC059827 TaxID=3346964 RepID=UPI00364A9F5B